MSLRYGVIVTGRIHTASYKEIVLAGGQRDAVIGCFLWFWVIFEGEEGVFGGEASGVACEGAVCAYHAVAWDEDADAVCSDGLRHGPDGFWIADAKGNVFVAPCGAVWDWEQGVPHTLLEIGAHRA